MPEIEIFRAGRQTDRHGVVMDVSEADVAAIAAAYDAAAHESPVVIGHPTHNGPAYAWVKGLRADDGVLKAELDQVDPEFAELVAKGRYKKVSASFYLAGSPSNPKPGALYLRHVGFLGAQPPAVKGLRAPEFGEDEAGIVHFEEAEGGADAQPPSVDNGDGGQMTKDLADAQAKVAALEAEVARLQAEKAAAEQARAEAENAEYCEALCVAGKLPPTAKGQALALLNAASVQAAGGVAEFGEGESLHGNLKAFLDSLPQALAFGETATKDRAAETAGDSLEYAEGTPAASIEADQRIRAYAKEHGVSYVEAFNALYK